MSKKPKTRAISMFTASIITTVSIALVLFLLGLTTLIGFTANGVTSYLKENLNISIEIAEHATEPEIAKLQKTLNRNKYVKSATYISKKEVKKQLVEELGRDPEGVLGYDPAKAYFDVSVKAEYVNSDSLKLVQQSLAGAKIVDKVVYDKDDIATATNNLSIIGSVLLLLAAILVLISFTLIRSIIQLNIYSKRFLINTMQLVGATNGFIRRPFVWSMVGCGLMAAVLANLGIIGVVYYIISAFPESITIVGVDQLLMVFGVVFVFGLVIAIFATMSAVNKYLRMTTNKIYRA